MNESSLDRRYRFVIVGLLLWANFAFGLSFAAMAPILPVITEHYGISHTMAGLLVGVIFIIEAIFGLPGGVIVGWLGQKRSYTISFFMMGAVTLTALSPRLRGATGLTRSVRSSDSVVLPCHCAPSDAVVPTQSATSRIRPGHSVNNGGIRGVHSHGGAAV